jgi:predicted ATPase
LLELGRLLGDPLNRVVTALGPGGAGKTRLALQAVGAEAERFPGGLVWVPLASAADMEGAVAAVAQALDVGERPGYSLIDVVTEVLAGGSRRLLLLDNLEHLLPAFAEAVSVIVRHAPAVTVVATSRERLRVAGERVYELPTLAEADARELFKARAAAITLSPSGDDDAVSELCRRLDFLPLAIELAAARTALFTPEQLLARLGKRLDLLRGSRDADPRHATLRATIEWSFGLLDAEEQRLLCALSIFPAGCTYEMAEAVCDCEPMLLEALIDKSLVRRRETVAEPRYWMLETIREFARPLLEQADVYDEVRRKFMAAQRDFAAAYEPSWLTKDSTLWYRRFQLELDNLREAMAISAATGDHETVLATAGDLTGGWQRAGLLHEGTDRVLDALGRASEAPSGTVGMAQFCLGVLASESGNTTEALEQLRAALPLVDPYRPEIGVFARYLIFELTLADDRPEAAKVLEEAARVAETTDNPTLIIITLLSKAELLASEDPVRAYELAARAVEVARGWEAGRLVEALHGFGVVAENAGDRQQARAALNEAVLLARDELERGDAGAGDDALVSLGLLAALDNERDAAAACGERLHAHLERRDSVAPPIAAQLAVLDAAVAALEGRREDAVRLIGAAEETLRLTSAPAFLIAAKTYDALLAPLRLALEP